jgi:hypothetical protein
MTLAKIEEDQVRGDKVYGQSDQPQHLGAQESVIESKSRVGHLAKWWMTTFIQCFNAGRCYPGGAA